jgi:Kef-type K+ transport system membrane component KefB
MEETATTLFLIMAIAVFSPVLSSFLKRWIRIPALVFEIVLGIVIGAQVLAWAEITPTIDFIGQLGLAVLFFLAGFEIDPNVIKGRPLRLAGASWVTSLVLGIGTSLFLHATDVIDSDSLVAFALTTTALGVLFPILSDEGIDKTFFGTHVTAAGTIGEFLPIVAIALFLSGTSPSTASEALFLFAIVAVVLSIISARLRPPKVFAWLQSTLRTSAQEYVRFGVLIIGFMVLLAAQLGLDFLLGAFTAGVLYRLILSGAEPDDVDIVESKMQAIGFGFFVPVFFVVTGMGFDVDALFSSPTAMLKVPMFVGLFLLVRGAPALWFYRHDLGARQRIALMFIQCTALPLIVAITAIGLDTGKMRESTAVALVMAGLISVIIFPIIGFAINRGATHVEESEGA